MYGPSASAPPSRWHRKPLTETAREERISLFAKLKVWEHFGRIMNSRWGIAFIDATRGVVEKLITPLAAGKSHEPCPFTPLGKELAQARVAMITTTGIYVEGQEPFDTEAALGDPTFRAIPSDVDVSRLRIAHTHFPHQRAEEDINVIFPLERLRELVDEKAIGSLAALHYSFGFDLHVKELVDSAREMAGALAEDGVDVVLLTPG